MPKDKKNADNIRYAEIYHETNTEKNKQKYLGKITWKAGPLPDNFSKLTTY